MDGFSYEIDQKLLKLESIGERLQEGLVGWFSNKNAAPAVAFYAPGLIALHGSLMSAVRESGQYLVILEAAKGNSSYMNRALDTHMRSIRRVMNANQTIGSSILEALEKCNAEESKPQ